MNTYLEKVNNGRNSWKAYISTIVVAVAGIAIGGLIFGVLTPFMKSIFPNGEFGKSIGTFVIIGGTFGFGLLGFLFGFKKFYQRPIMSLFGSLEKFNFSLYTKGFLIYGFLIFAINLVTEFNTFQNFKENFNFSNFLVLATIGFLCLGLQSFFVEILFRSYLLQGMSLKIKRILWLVILNGFLFGMFHLGYGVESFIQNFLFGLVSTLITLKLGQIEFVAGAHNANNLVLSLVFVNLNEEIESNFSWEIDWIYLSLDILAYAILIFIIYKLFK
jgi:membrane protease YdiL (CAAX protease family)